MVSSEQVSVEFAPNIARTEQGLVSFPSDRKIRQQLWSENYADHPAKYSCYLVWELAKYLTTEGQTILDPMSGTGTTMLASMIGRGVICIELVEKYYMMQQHVYKNLGEPNNVVLLHGDCNKFLPLPADCIIFSPPYPTVTMGKYLTRPDGSKVGDEDFTDYDNVWSAASVSEFMYWQRMEKIYSKLLQSAPLMAYTIRDSIKNGKRQPWVDMSIKLCEKLGWKLQENILVKAYSTAFTAVRRTRELEIVENESILVFRR